MFDEGRILYGTNNNTMFTSLYNSNTIIFIEELNNFRDIMIFVHELAHAYYFNINNSRLVERNDISVELKDEIPAKIMEIKFINYLYNNGSINEGTILEDFFVSIMMECDKKRNGFDYLKYLVASYIAFKLKDEEFMVDKYYKHISQQNIFNLIDEVNNKKKMGKILRK